jgi:hypothetical protein
LALLNVKFNACLEHRLMVVVRILGSTLSSLIVLHRPLSRQVFRAGILVCFSKNISVYPLWRTSRHDLITTSWRRIAARAGVHTSAEPHSASSPPLPQGGEGMAGVPMRGLARPSTEVVGLFCAPCLWILGFNLASLCAA